ncbi:MAG: DNA repair protein RecO [Gammaproteobacteria bacterium]|nr:MAG: DNA repair protein RecO [Gammaproteobacteria bacterium]
MVTSVKEDYAYLLHRVPYRDQSVLAHFLTQANGKVSAVINGIKSTKNNRRALLQSTRQLRVSYTLKPGLSRLTLLELADSQPTVPNVSYFLFYQYMNELLLTILPEQLPSKTIYNSYSNSLALLNQDQPHSALRQIEMALIEQFDDLPDLTTTVDTQEQIKANCHYFFHPEHGVWSINQTGRQHYFLGSQLLAFNQLINNRDDCGHLLPDEAIAKEAKPVTRHLIDQLLNGKSLKTRTAFKDLRHYL